MATKKGVSHNCRDGLEIVKSEYESTLSRFKELDNKLNMLLVFAAGEIAAFGGTFSSISLKYDCKLAYIITFLSLLLSAVITILIGLFTKSLDILDTSDLVTDEKLEESEFIDTYINAYNESIDSIEKQIRKKCRLFNVSLIFILLALIDFSIFMLIGLLL